MAGAVRSKATPSRSTSTGCGANWVAMPFELCAASAISSPRNEVQRVRSIRSKLLIALLALVAAT